MIHDCRCMKPLSIDASSLDRVRAWSDGTFGPGLRTEGVIDHIKREFDEVRNDPTVVDEWIDVIILAFDGASRTGASGQEIIDAIHAKWERNRGRDWPDWRTLPHDRAIEHVRGDG